MCINSNEQYEGSNDNSVPVSAITVNGNEKTLVATAQSTRMSNEDDVVKGTDISDKGQHVNATSRQKAKGGIYLLTAISICCLTVLVFAIFVNIRQMNSGMSSKIFKCFEAINGHDYVDLGLSVKWATMNIGATGVTDYGNYYAWGETKAYGEEDTSNGMNYNYNNSKNSYTKSCYDYSTYKWCNGSYESMTKYCTDTYFGTIDNKTTLDPEDDAAVQNWGGAWRTPTYAEQEELRNNCYWVWTSSYKGSGIAGYIVYAAKVPFDKGQVARKSNASSVSYSLSDSHIFLPAAGFRYGSLLGAVGIGGCYWSSTLVEHSNGRAYAMRFYSDCHNFTGYRCYGFFVRAVRE